MNGSLASFQSTFAHALFTPDAGDPVSSQPAFAVYRNTVMKGWVDALQANYPAVARLVGSDWFRGAAMEYARSPSVDDARLVAYGRGFPEFLAQCPAAGDLPYLAGVASLDRAWTQAHVAADASTDCVFLATLPAQELGQLRVAAHPAARWAWFEAMPVFTIWSRNRSDALSPDNIEWRSEGTLLTRPDGAVQWREASRGECAFLDACAAPGGTSLAQAAAAALQAEPATNLSELLAGLLRAGALVFPSASDQGAPS